MNRKFPGTALFALTAFLISPLQTIAADEIAVTLPDSAQWAMTAPESGQRYQIFAAWPAAATGKPLPVVYVLDANTMFGTMVDTVRALARRPSGQQALVVGIGYPDGVNVGRERAYDLTADPCGRDPAMPNTGGAEAFLRFIERELKPAVAERFPIDSKRETFFGHSFGGHFVLYTLVNKPGLFDNYVAASPSIWFEDKLLTRNPVRNRLAAKLAVGSATPRVLITVGSNEQAVDPDFPPADPAALAARGQVDNAREYAEFLSRQPGLQAHLEILAGEDHGTVIPVAITRAVRFAFAPNVAPPAPAAKAEPFQNPTEVAVPNAESYIAMTAKERYDLRIHIRSLPERQRKPWIAEFNRVLSERLTYGEHCVLHEERVTMDKRHGTAPHED